MTHEDEDEPGGGITVRPPAPRLPVTTLPTRQLCAAMNLDAELRGFVLSLFLGQRHRAWGPNYGVDTTTVIRHAWRARRWQRLRDAVLGVALLGIVALLVLRWWSRGDLPAVATAVAWVVAAVVFHRIVRRRKGTVWKTLRSMWGKKTTGRRVLVVALFGLLASGYWLVQALRRGDLVVALALLLIVLAIALVDAFVVVRRVRAALTGGLPDGVTPLFPHDQAPALSTKRETWLAALSDVAESAWPSEDPHARVIAYDLDNWREDSLKNTFVGSGFSVGDFEISIDVSKGRQTRNGKVKKSQTIDLMSLHRSLEEIALTKDLPGAWTGYRMYVDGRNLRGKNLLSEAGGRPVSWLPLDEVLAGLTGPTASLRTYQCFQVPVVNWNEKIILTLFIRADLTETNLILHTEMLMLPMMDLSGCPLIAEMPRDWWTHATAAVRLGATQVWRTSLHCFLWPLTDLRQVLRRRRAAWTVRYRLRHEQVVSHGAFCSVRESLAEGVRVVHPNAVQDINRTIHFLMQELRNGLAGYLRANDIDTSSLGEEISTVITKQKIAIDRLSADNVVIGKGKAGDTVKTAKGDTGS
ncbi:hypothetical protein [Actinoplanes sp. NPDC020271]|uniref:hypothetical protein n=1 Tax=Actinoplanes sp. NPDC020271 TaxID=3363896 RepID=UPI00378DA8FC